MAASHRKLDEPWQRQAALEMLLRAGARRMEVHEVHEVCRHLLFGCMADRSASRADERWRCGGRSRAEQGAGEALRSG